MVIQYNNDIDEGKAFLLQRVFGGKVVKQVDLNNISEDLIVLGTTNGPNLNPIINQLLALGGFVDPADGRGHAEEIQNLNGSGFSAFILFSDSVEGLQGIIGDIIKNDSLPAIGGADPVDFDPIPSLQLIKIQNSVPFADLLANKNLIVQEANNFLLREQPAVEVLNVYVVEGGIEAVVSGPLGLIAPLVIGLIIFAVLALIWAIALIFASIAVSIWTVMDVNKTKVQNESDLKDNQNQRAFTERLILELAQTAQSCRNNCNPADQVCLANCNNYDLAARKVSEEGIKSTRNTFSQEPLKDDLWTKFQKILFWTGIGVLGFVVTKEFLLPYLAERRKKGEKK